MTAFCINCDCKRPYRIEHRWIKHQGRGGVGFMYKQLYASCEHCGEELYVPEVNDINVHERQKCTERLIP